MRKKKAGVELINKLKRFVAVHVIIINKLFSNLVEDDPVETKANKHTESRDHE